MQLSTIIVYDPSGFCTSQTSLINGSVIGIISPESLNSFMVALISANSSRAFGLLSWKRHLLHFFYHNSPLWGYFSTIIALSLDISLLQNSINSTKYFNLTPWDKEPLWNSASYLIDLFLLYTLQLGNKRRSLHSKCVYCEMDVGQDSISPLISLSP